MKERATYLAKTFAVTVVVFIIGKTGFMVYNSGDHAFTPGDVLDVVWHGMTLDLSTALYLLIIPFLATVASVFTGSPRWLRGVLKGYYVLIAIAMALGIVADACLYEFWQFKLDATCLQYLATPTEAMASVTTDYLLLRALVVLLLAVAIYCCYAFPSWEFPKSRHVQAEAVLAILSVPLFVIGIRGGLGESTTNIGQVYYSPTQFLNHAAVNPVFSFMASFESTANGAVAYDFYTEDELQQLTAGLYSSDTLPGDTLLRNRRPNVVIVLLESCGSMFLEVMPHLRQAAAEGISFSQCYGNSYRTDRGTVSALSGYLSFPTMSVMKMSSKVAHLPAIARSLQREGYTTEYLYGGDINFTKMKGYLVSTGFERLHWMQDYTLEEQHTAQWGVRDDITFRTLADMIRRHDDDRPFLIGYSTLSSHDPWDVPVSKYKEKQYNGFSYVDDCIGTFLSDIRQTRQWDNLLIIFLPDHSSDFHEYTEQHPDRNRIPMIWTGGAVSESRQLDMICNQSDLAATLLGQMGVDHRDFRFSRDVTSMDYRYPFAIHMYNNGLSMTDSTGFMVYDLSAQRVTASTTTDTLRMERTAKAILQMASEDLSSK